MKHAKTDRLSVLRSRPPADYISTILKSKSWGGALELSVFAAHFRTEIRSIDVQTGRVDRFGEDAGYETFVLLVYSGIRASPRLIAGGLMRSTAC